MVLSPGDQPRLATLAVRSVARQFDGSIGHGSADPSILTEVTVILVVNGSLPPPLRDVVDDAADVLSGRLTIVTRPDCADLGTALNAGLAAGEAPWVIRQDPDDLSLPDRFTRLLTAAATGEWDLLGSALIERNGDGQLWLRRYPSGESAIRRELARNNPFAHSTVIVRRSLLDAAGGYRRRAFMEDYDLWARMIAAGARVDNLPEPLVVYSAAGLFTRRAHPASVGAEAAMLTELVRLGLLPAWRAPLLLAGRIGYRLAPDPVKRAAYRAAYRRPLTAEQTATTIALLGDLAVPV